MSKARAFEPWTPAEDQVLRDLICHRDLDMLAKQLRRSIGAVASRAAKLGLMERVGRSIQFKEQP